MGAGAAAFLTKPFSPLRLIEEVESVLDKVS
jgi:FixJ family two-component response regulator